MRQTSVSSPIGLRVLLTIGVLLVSVLGSPTGPAEARDGNRTLKLYFSHTGERGEFTFKRNGRFDRAEVARINKFLRDWRRNEPAKMDPQLLDLIWSIYRQTGSRDYVHVVSAYRSLATNNMLRKRSRGVAEKSQHTAGKAMDFYIPGVPLAKLRGIAMKAQGGGVGYYPRSGSPFVHVDTGNVRSWPRMTREQLLALFPNGETLYLPTDGKPLPGYQRALARRKSPGGTALAYLETGSDEIERRRDGNAGGWLKRVFDGGADEQEDDASSATALAAVEAVAAPEPAAAPPARATGEPQMLIAGLPGEDVRLPKARPFAQPAMVAAAAPADLLAGASPASIDDTGGASFAFAPLPRSRPDAATLAATLASGQEGGTLAVPAEDALGALAAMAPAEIPPPSTIESAAVTVAAAEPAPSNTEDASADLAILAAFAAIDDVAAPANAALAQAAANARGGTAISLPRPRPLALAFTGDGLEPPTPAPAPVAPAELRRTVIDQPVETAAINAPPSAADLAELRHMIADAPTGEREFAGFAMPQPAGAAGLFAAPDSAAAIASASTAGGLPTGQFQRAETESPAQESFFSRLFASLAQ